MIIMYSINVIGKANVLSCNQINELIQLRKKMGITSGGVPYGNTKSCNLTDEV